MPDLDILNPNGSLWFGAIEETISRMVFPDSDELSRQYLLDQRLGSKATIDAIVKQFISIVADSVPDMNKFIEITTPRIEIAKRKLENDAKEELQKMSGVNYPLARLAQKNAEYGCFAGETLLSLITLKEAGEKFGLLRARFLALKLLDTQRTYTVQGRGRRWADMAWSNFKSVAHLWAAHIYYERATPENRPSPDPFQSIGEEKPIEFKAHQEAKLATEIHSTNIKCSWCYLEYFGGFLGLAKWFYHEALNIHPDRSTEPILDPGKSWLIPAVLDIPMISPKISQPKDIATIMKRYESTY